MDENQGSRTSQTVKIDKKAMSHIKDRARTLFQEYPGGEDHLHRVMFQALLDYVEFEGGTPGFEVKL